MGLFPGFGRLGDIEDTIKFIQNAISANIENMNICLDLICMY